MSDGPEWFAAKRRGLGSGMPIAWQGWALLGAYLAIVFSATRLVEEKPLVFAAILVPVTILFVIICARTTRGGWRWRNGDDD